VNQFERWLRRAIAPAGLSDVAIASIAGALAWLITLFLRGIVDLIG
jgi:hypothetical protein